MEQKSTRKRGGRKTPGSTSRQYKAKAGRKKAKGEIKSTARKKSDKPTLILAFGARPEGESRQIIGDQSYEAHKYYNTLIRIEQERLRTYRDLRGSLDPSLEELERHYDSLEEAVLNARQRMKEIDRSEREDSPEADEVRNLREVASSYYKDVVRPARKSVEDRYYVPADRRFSQLHERNLFRLTAENHPEHRDTIDELLAKWDVE